MENGCWEAINKIYYNLTLQVPHPLLAEIHWSWVYFPFFKSRWILQFAIEPPYTLYPICLNSYVNCLTPTGMQVSDSIAICFRLVILSLSSVSHWRHPPCLGNQSDCLSVPLSLGPINAARQPSKQLIFAFLLRSISPLISYFWWCTDPVWATRKIPASLWSYSLYCEKVFKNLSLQKAVSLMN